MLVLLPMRDDLHKSAPVKAVWRRWTRSCINRAEQGETADERARRALAEDCRAEISPKFVANLLQLAAGQAELFEGKLAHVRCAQDLGGSGSVLEEGMLSQLRLLDRRGGGFDSSGVEAAAAGTLQDRLSAQARAVRGHIMIEGGKGKEHCLQEVRRSEAAVDTRQLARELVTNKGQIELARRAVPPPSLDENLLRIK